VQVHVSQTFWLFHFSTCGVKNESELVLSLHWKEAHPDERDLNRVAGQIVFVLHNIKVWQVFEEPLKTEDYTELFVYTPKLNVVI
jgi:hypothetical protein